MAKKIVITGTDLLQSVNDPWGGVNNTEETIQVYGTDVPPGYEWGMNRGEVERFIKAEYGTKAGAFYVDAGYLYFFATIADKEAWIAEPDDQYVLDKVKLPEGGDTPSDALAIYSLDSTQYYAKGAERVTVKFKVRNIVEGEPSLDIAVTMLNSQGTPIYYQRRPTPDDEGFYTIVIEGQYLRNIPNASEQFTLKVERTGEERMVQRSVSMYCIDLGLALYSGFNFGVPNPQNISYVPTFTLPTGMTNIKLVVDVYQSATKVYQHIETSSITTNNRVIVPLNWTDMPFTGIFTVKAYLDMGGGLIQSNLVETNIMCIMAGEEDSTSLVAIEPIGEVTLYDDVTPRIAAYHNGDDYATVKITLNGGKPTTLSMPTNRVYTEYSAAVEQQQNTLIAQVLDSEGQPIAGAVEEFTATGEFDWQTIEGYEHNLSGKGRSNEELPTPADWGGITTFEGFSWTASGSCWKNGALHMTGKSKAILNMFPFYSETAYNEQRRIGGGILDTGRTFRIRFKVSNVNEAKKRIIECFDGSVGFFCTADTLYVKMGNGGEITTDPETGEQATQNNRRFAADTEIELCITVQPYWDESYNLTRHMATMYVNGQFAGEAILSTTTLSQASQLPVTLYADGCDLDVYQITYYEKCLNSFEVLQNYVMALPSLNEMKAEFQKNQCYTGNGTVNFNETFKYCKRLSAQVGDTVEGTCNIIVNTHTFDPSVTDTDVYPEGQQELELFFFKNGEVDTSRSVKYVGEKTKDLRVRIQGTSTAMEYRKNMRYDCKGTVKVYRWSKEQYEAGGSNNPSDGWYYVEDKKKLAIYVRGDETTENACKLLTVKTNYNESTATRNLPMARWIDDAMRFLSTRTDGSGNLMFPAMLTPPQRTDAKVRQAIDGVPAVQFTHAVGSQDYQFSGKVDLITDKKNSGVFGFAEGGRDYSIEFRNGNTDICNFRCPYLVTAGKYLDGSFTEKGQDCLEYRWPDLDTGDTYYGDQFLRPDSAIQRLYDFVFNCHPDFVGYKSKNGVISPTNSIITIKGENRVDNATYRKQKFYAEMGNYMVKDSITFNAFVTKVLLWTDQRAKNQFFTHFVGDEVVSTYTDDLNEQGQTYEILRLLPYDIDTSLRGDNASRLRFDFTRLYTDADVFNDGASVVTVSEQFYPTQSAIADATAFINSRVKGKRSALFELLDDTCQKEYATYFELLAPGYLNVDALKRYCITCEADAFNSVIYNADTEYKYVASGSASDQQKAHGSAKEDLLWWLQGRMYFQGGENGAGNYTDSSIRATMCMDSVLDQTNRLMRIPLGASGITLRIRSRYRNYIGTRLGSTGQLAKQYAPDPEQYYDVTLITQGIGNEDSGRFNLYGQKFFDDIADLSKMYISTITSWADCTSLKTLKFGSDDEGFFNPALTDIKGSGNPVFGACETLDLRNCRAYADSDFRSFPALRELLLEGCDSLTELRLPTTDNLETLSLPKNVNRLEITDKSKIEHITLEQGGSVGQIECADISNTVVASVLSLLNQLYSEA